MGWIRGIGFREVPGALFPPDLRKGGYSNVGKSNPHRSGAYGLGINHQEGVQDFFDKRGRAGLRL